MTRKRPAPGSGLTPQLGEQLVFAETGQPVPKSEPEPPRRRRRTRLAAQPVPPRADLERLADELFGRTHGLDEIEKTYAGIKVHELRAERRTLDAELATVEHLVRQHRSLFPRDLIPTSLYGRFDRVRDALVLNEREMAQIRFTLAPNVDLEHPTPEQQRRAKTASTLEAVRTQARREAYAVGGVIGKMFGPPAPSAPDPLVSSSAGGSRLAMARASAAHPDHFESQRVRLPDGSTGQIFTGR